MAAMHKQLANVNTTGIQDYPTSVKSGVSPSMAQLREFGANGWSRGQYALLITASGLLLALHFWTLAIDPTSVGNQAIPIYFLPVAALGVQISAAIGLLISFLFAIGLVETFSALLIAYLLTAFSVIAPLSDQGDYRTVVWFLILHLVGTKLHRQHGLRSLTPAIFNWEFRPAAYLAAWLVIGFKLLSDGMVLIFQSLFNSRTAAPLPIVLGTIGVALACVAVPIAVRNTLRKQIWLTIVCYTVISGALVGPTAVPIGTLLILALCLDPSWILPVKAQGSGEEIVFFDGDCGLCHRVVLFVLPEDRVGRFKFAPLSGQKFGEIRKKVFGDLEGSAALPDSIVVTGSDGKLRMRFDAVNYIMQRLGGLWRIAALFTAIVPRALLNDAYDVIAARRTRYFAKPLGVCPMVPPKLQNRFDV
jgi:predicted DCC family thiol-disulfide oxidoreductase YuxK